MSSNFVNVQLFGGAMVALIPSQFADVSTIRQVPDNQEVYLDTDGFTSLTFDITERVSHLPTDQEALEYHFTDIVAEEDGREVLSTVSDLRLPQFPPSVKILSLTAKITPLSNPNPRPLAPTYVTMFLALIRLVEQATDLVVTLNVPQIPGTVDTWSESAIQDVGWKAVKSLEVKDWDLFNGE